MNRFDIIYFVAFSTCFAAKQSMIVEIPNQGMVAGVEIANMRIHKILGFYGIPYAFPPLGDLRFSPPATNPPPTWDGIRNMTEYATSCLQTPEGYKDEDLPFFELFNNIKLNTSEDCLYLNVFVPIGNKPPEGFTVIVWIHPGNFTTGTPAIWNPHTLVHRQRVIVVTFAYRLNVMGFFTTNDGEAPGNYGLMDQQAALNWVKSNIHLFNGNPDNIVLMGSGSGGVSIGIHMVNAESRGLFHKAIIMSSDLMNQAVYRLPDEDKSALEKLADKFGCVPSPTSKTISCLRGVEADYLVNGTAYVNWRPLIDKELSNSTPAFLTDLPKNSFERGEFYPVPLLTGYTKMEKILSIKTVLENGSHAEISREYQNNVLKDIINRDMTPTPVVDDEDIESCSFDQNTYAVDAAIFFYGSPKERNTIDNFRKIITDFTTEKSYGSPTFQQAMYISSEGQPTFVYRFDVKPSSPEITSNIPDWVTVPHLFDLIYVWGVPYWRHDAEYDVRDKRISDAIMSFWTSFAKYSTPTKQTPYPINWQPFTKENPGILLIDNTFTMSDESTVNFKAFDFWNSYFPKLLELNSQCCAATGTASSFTGNLKVILSFVIVLLVLTD